MERYIELYNPNFPSSFKLRCFDASHLEIFEWQVCPKWIVPDRVQLLCLSPFYFYVLKFCKDRPFGFSAYQDNFLFNVSNFCLDCPFGFSAHRDAHFCLSHPFWVFGLPSCSLKNFFLDKVFLDCICVYGSQKFFIVHGLNSHGTTGEGPFDNVRALIVRRPLAPGIGLKT